MADEISDLRRGIVDRDLTPKPCKDVGLRSEGGSYHVWKSSDVSMLSEAKVGAAKLILNHRGLALPHYSDSSKVCYVLEGCGIVGIVIPETETEQVVSIRTGDAVGIPMGAISWWLNDGSSSSRLVVLFLGDTSKAHRSGEFTDFLLMGRPDGLFNGFSSEFVCRAWDLEEHQMQKLLENQRGSRIVSLKDDIPLPTPTVTLTGASHLVALAFNCEEAKRDVDVANGGRVVVLTGDNLPVLRQIGLGADLVKLDPGAMCSPGFSSDSAFQVTYIVRGSGRVQVVGTNGQRVLDREIKAGELFIVPRFFVVSKIAGNEGMEWFSIITTPNPVFCHLAGRTSVWKALSPQILRASFSVDEEMENLFRSKRTQDAIFFPPPK